MWDIVFDGTTECLKASGVSSRHGQRGQCGQYDPEYLRIWGGTI